MSSSKYQLAILASNSRRSGPITSLGGACGVSRRMIDRWSCSPQEGGFLKDKEGRKRFSYAVFVTIPEGTQGKALGSCRPTLGLLHYIEGSDPNDFFHSPDHLFGGRREFSLDRPSERLREIGRRTNGPEFRIYGHPGYCWLLLAARGGRQMRTSRTKETT